MVYPGQGVFAISGPVQVCLVDYPGYIWTSAGMLGGLSRLYLDQVCLVVYPGYIWTRYAWWIIPAISGPVQVCLVDYPGYIWTSAGMLGGLSRLYLDQCRYAWWFFYLFFEVGLIFLPLFGTNSIVFVSIFLGFRF